MEKKETKIHVWLLDEAYPKWSLLYLCEPYTCKFKLILISLPYNFYSLGALNEAISNFCTYWNLYTLLISL